MQSGLHRAGSVIYLASALLLVVAAVFTLVGTVVDLVEGSRSREITDTGVLALVLAVSLHFLRKSASDQP